MTKKEYLQIDCIADVHLSAHIIPPILPMLKRRRYDVFLTECGGGLEQDDSCLSPNSSALHELVHQQLKYAQESKTLNLGRQIAELIGCEPITIDHPGYWMSAMKGLERLTTKFREKSDEDKSGSAPYNAWKDTLYRAEVINLYRSLMVRRDSWMLGQIKSILSTVSGKRRRPVHALLLVGLGHATVLEESLKSWCRFHHLVNLSAAKTAVSEYLKLLGGGSELQLELVRSFAALRHELIKADLAGWGVPEGEIRVLMQQIAPNSLEKPRIERWYHPSGTAAAEIPYRNNRYEGIAKYYYEESGALQAEASYKDGRLSGHYRCYGKTGIVQCEQIYKDGQLDGVSRWYSESGTLLTLVSYRNGKSDGQNKEFYEGGQLKSEASFKQGLQDGLGKSYYKNGKLKAEFQYRAGKPHGLTRHYSEDGEVVSKVRYHNGNEVAGAKRIS